MCSRGYTGTVLSLQYGVVRSFASTRVVVVERANQSQDNFATFLPWIHGLMSEGPQSGALDGVLFELLQYRVVAAR